jgi:hypothetical protein
MGTNARPSKLKLKSQTPDFDNVIAGMQNRKTRRTIEARRGHVEVIADPNHVRIGVVGKDDRVGVCAVPVVRDPDLIRSAPTQKFNADEQAHGQYQRS